MKQIPNYRDIYQPLNVVALLVSTPFFLKHREICCLSSITFGLSQLRLSWRHRNPCWAAMERSCCAKKLMGLGGAAGRRNWVFWWMVSHTFRVFWSVEMAWWSPMTCLCSWRLKPPSVLFFQQRRLSEEAQQKGQFSATGCLRGMSKITKFSQNLVWVGVGEVETHCFTTHPADVFYSSPEPQVLTFSHVSYQPH